MGVVTPHFGRQMHCAHSLFSVSFNKHVKTDTFIGKPFITPLREAADPLNAEAINILVSPSRRSFGSRCVMLADPR